MTKQLQLIGTRTRAWWHKEGRSFLVLIVVLFSIRSSLADWNDVPSGSMRPNLVEGDRIFVNKLAYDLKIPFTTWHLANWGDPRLGDIVVFYSPFDGQRLVKRVIGTPGDLVELRGNQLVLNGQTLAYEDSAEDPLQHLGLRERPTATFSSEQLPGHAHLISQLPLAPSPRRDFGPVRVPEGFYFMMGDNRDNSFDSRFYGPVPRGQILGRAQTVVFSLNRDHYFLPRSQRFLKSLAN
jgi:signal peptidase I